MKIRTYPYYNSLPVTLVLMGEKVCFIELIMNNEGDNVP